MPTDEPTRAELLAQFLAGVDTPCPGCGYNVRGLRATRCPECNQELELRLNLVEPRLGVWIGAIAAYLAAGGGALMCLLLVVFLSIWRNDWPRRSEFFALVTYPGMIVGFSAIIAWAIATPWGRRWFRALPVERRVLFVVLSWATIPCYVGFFLKLVLTR